MEDEPIIEDAVRKAAETFYVMLEGFYPARGDNGFCERNLTFQFAHAFVSMEKQRCAFMEVPWCHAESDRWIKRIDGYVFTPEIGIFIECKQIYQKRKADALLADLERLSHTSLTRVINEFTRLAPKNHQHPKKFYALGLAESWNADVTRWYSIFKDYRVNSLIVKTFEWKKQNRLQWIYAYKQIDVL